MIRNLRFLRACIISSAIALFSLPAMADFRFGHSKGAMEGLGLAYAYLLRQDYTLKRIAKFYPSLQASVRNAELEFSLAYGTSIKDQLAEAITEEIGSEHFNRVAKIIDSSVGGQVSSTSISYQEAVNFIEEVKSRSRGNVDKKTLQYLVAAQYKGRPASEFSSKMLQKFNTHGHSKSLGLNLVLDLPVSWVAAESKYPEIVQKWQSMVGNGKQFIMLEILESGAKVSKQELLESVNRVEIEKTVPPGVKFIEGGAQTIGSIPGYWADYSMEIEAAGMKIYQVGRVNTFFTSDKLFIILCMTMSDSLNKEEAGGDYKEEAHSDFTKIKALCPMVVNSVVLKDIY